MPYAKLSSALLARKAPAAPGIALGPPPSEVMQLLADYLKALKLPGFLRDHQELAQQCAAEGLDHSRYLLRLVERELAERHYRRVERLIRQARFPAVKSLDDFDFAAIPSLDKELVLKLARCDFIARRENVIAVGGTGTGKTHLAIGLGLAACHRGLRVGFVTASSLVNELVEARAEWQLVRLERRFEACELLIIDELGYKPLASSDAELFFEIVSRRCERGSMIITSNLPIEEWVSIFGSERLTSALLDRLSWRLHIIETNGESYRLMHGNRHPPTHPGNAAEPERSSVSFLRPTASPAA